VTADGELSRDPEEMGRLYTAIGGVPVIIKRRGIVTNKSFLRGQSVLEYALLIITVSAVFIAMNLYVRRAVNDRLHTMEIEISPPIAAN
jgi:hypothetical protein